MQLQSSQVAVLAELGTIIRNEKGSLNYGELWNGYRENDWSPHAALLAGSQQAKN